MDTLDFSHTRDCSRTWARRAIDSVLEKGGNGIERYVSRLSEMRADTLLENFEKLLVRTRLRFLSYEFGENGSY